MSDSVMWILAIGRAEAVIYVLSNLTLKYSNQVTSER